MQEGPAPSGMPAPSHVVEHIGPLVVKPTDQEIRFCRDPDHLEAALLRAAGGSATLYGSGGSIRHLIASLPRRLP
jgi:hypothetical protein